MEPAQETKTNAPAKRHIRNFLIDSRFQLGWVSRVAITTTIIVGILGFFLYTTLSESTDLVIVNALNARGLAPAAQRALIEQGPQDKMTTLAMLFGSLFGLVIILSLLTIVATHKIAGPAYKMKKLFNQINGNQLQLRAKLRKGDELDEIFEEFSNMLRRLREARHTDIERMTFIKENLDSQDGQKALDDLLQNYKQSVNMK